VLAGEAADSKYIYLTPTLTLPLPLLGFVDAQGDHPCEVAPTCPGKRERERERERERANETISARWCRPVQVPERARERERERI